MGDVLWDALTENIYTSQVQGTGYRVVGVDRGSRVERMQMEWKGQRW